MNIDSWIRLAGATLIALAASCAGERTEPTEATPNIRATVEAGISATMVSVAIGEGVRATIAVSPTQSGVARPIDPPELTVTLPTVPITLGSEGLRQRKATDWEEYPQSVGAAWEAYVDDWDRCGDHSCLRAIAEHFRDEIGFRAPPSVDHMATAHDRLYQAISEMILVHQQFETGSVRPSLIQRHLDAYQEVGDAADYWLTQAKQANILDEILPRLDISLLAIEHFNAGLVFLKEGSLAEAVSEFDAAIREEPEWALAYLNRGISYSKSGQVSEGIRDYDEAIRLDPELAGAYNSRGLYYTRTGDNERAIKDFSEAIHLDSLAPEAYTNRGIVFKRLGQLEQAKSDYDEAIRLNPQYAQAYINRGAYYQISGEFKQAVQDYDEGIRLDPSIAKAYFNRGSSYFYLNQPERAIKDFDEAIRLDDRIATAYATRALAYTVLGRNSRQDVESAIALGIERQVLEEAVERIKRRR